MTNQNRSTSLHLARREFGSHKKVAEMLSSLTKSKVSDWATGRNPISDHEAQSIERLLRKPSGWLDRDQRELLNMATNDYDLFQALKNLSDDTKVACLALFRSLDTRR